MPVDQDQFLLEVYKDQIAQGRHLEMQRLEVTKFILAAVAALLALAGTLKFSIHCLPICLAIMWLGRFGAAMTRTFVERFDGHMNRARAARRQLDQRVAGGAIQCLLDDNPVVKSERIREFWIKLHCHVVVVGFLALLWNLAAIASRLALASGNFCHRLLGQLALNGQ